MSSETNVETNVEILVDLDGDTLIDTVLDISNIHINGERLWASLMELAKIGATPKGGVCRLTLTDLDKQGRDLVLRWAEEAGMTITIDRIGNGFMRRAGRNNSLPPIMTGTKREPSSLVQKATSMGASVSMHKSFNVRTTSMPASTP